MSYKPNTIYTLKSVSPKMISTHWSCLTRQTELRSNLRGREPRVRYSLNEKTKRAIPHPSLSVRSFWLYHILLEWVLRDSGWIKCYFLVYRETAQCSSTFIFPPWEETEPSTQALDCREKPSIYHDLSKPSVKVSMKGERAIEAHFRRPPHRERCSQITWW